MSIHLYNTYKVQRIAPCRGAEYEARNGPGGSDANKRRPVAKLDGETDLNSADGGRETGASVPRTSRSLSFPDNLSPNLYHFPDKAGGYEVPGDGGLGRNRDMWL